MAQYNLHVNGSVHAIEGMSDMPLLWALRDELGLTGTKFGCGVGLCGACAVLVNGKEQRSCQVTVGQVGSSKITTIEGLSPDGNHPVQRAWLEHDVPQCGYCQAGQIIAATSLLAHKPHPTDSEIDDVMGGHICRCGTYQRIREAVKTAAAGGAK